MGTLRDGFGEKCVEKKPERRPTLPIPCGISTIGPEGLNDRIRNGIGCGPLGMGAPETGWIENYDNDKVCIEEKNVVKPHDRLVPLSLRPHSPSTCGLSTWWSTRGLQGPCGPGDLVLEEAWRLDAFSAYPLRTRLTSVAPGGTTGTPSVRPPRSSRTVESSPQVSFAHMR